MKVSLINVNLVAHDAIGQCILNQTRFFQRRGDDVRIYVMSPPQGVPDAVTALAWVGDLTDLLVRQDDHFTSSDLYVFHYPGHYPLIETLKNLDRGAVIFYYHNVTPPELCTSEEERHLLRRSHARVGELASYSDLIVTDSSFNAEQLVEEHAADYDAIRVLPLAVPLDQFSPGVRDMALLRRYNLEGCRILLFVGRMAGNKRIDLLVEALPLIQAQVPNAKLLLVGDDSSNPAFAEYVTKVKARAKKLKVADHVIFTGRVEDLPSYYRLADVYVTASLHEGFGVPLIEAMASGTPVVASRATAHPWVVGDAGLLTEPGDPADLAAQVVCVLTDDALRGELVRRGLARARDFSLDQYEAEWSKIVAEATAWLPDQPYPRSITVQPMSTNARLTKRKLAPSNRTLLLQSEFDQLGIQADVMMRDYVVRSKIPLVGPFLAWLRKNLTSHLREPYLDIMFERQVAFNQHIVQLLQLINTEVSTRAVTEEHPEDVAQMRQQLAAVQQMLTATQAEFAEIKRILLSIERH